MGGETEQLTDAQRLHRLENAVVQLLNLLELQQVRIDSLETHIQNEDWEYGDVRWDEIWNGQEVHRTEIPDWADVLKAGPIPPPSA